MGLMIKSLTVSYFLVRIRSLGEIEDEHDVQDLFHALLKFYFDDIRAE